VDGAAIKDYPDFFRHEKSKAPGSVVELTIFRFGQEMRRKVTFSGVPEFFVSDADIPPSQDYRKRTSPVEVVLDVADGLSIDVLAVSPDGTRLAYGESFGHYIILFDIAADKRLRRIRIDKGAKALQFSADGASLLLADGNKLKKIDIESGRATSSFSVITPSDRPLLLSSAAFSHDGSHVAFSDYGSSIGVVDVATGKVFAVLHHSADLIPSANISCLAFSRDGTWLLAGADDGTVKITQAQPVGQIPTNAKQNDGSVEMAAFEHQGLPGKHQRPMPPRITE
jgi:WD40 repeat protein